MQSLARASTLGNDKPPRSLRDASVTVSSTAWKHDPTPIIEPSNRQRNMPNTPFTGGMGTRNTGGQGKKPTRGGNPNRTRALHMTRALGQMDDGRPSKRQKTESIPGPSKHPRPSRRSLNLNDTLDSQDARGSAQPFSASSRSRSSTNEVVDLSTDTDQEEDVEILDDRKEDPDNENDELDLIGNNRPLKPLQKFHEDAKAGPSTEAVVHALQERQWAGDSLLTQSSGSSRPQSPRVKKIVRKFEQMSQSRPEPRESIKNRMNSKGKKYETAPSGLNYELLGPGDGKTKASNPASSEFAVNSQTTPTLSAARSSSPPPNVEDAEYLPLKGWIIGDFVHEEQHAAFISCRKKSSAFVLKQRKDDGRMGAALSFLSTDANFHVEAVRAINGVKLKDATLKLSHIQTNAVAGPLSTHVKAFASSRPETRQICFRFDLEHEQWDQANYASLVERLVGVSTSRGYIDDNAVVPQWQAAVTTAHLSQRESQRNKKPSDRETQDMLSSIVADQKKLRQKEPPKPREYDRETLGLRRSSRSSVKQQTDASEQAANIPDADETVLVYPPSGRGSVNITKGDVHRLVPGEYLNDTLVEFGLKLWLYELEDSRPDIASEIHVFSSFFYKKLNMKNLEEGYKAVRKWTSKIDIFSKKYLIIPINENFHWYLAIIYMPEYALQLPPLSQQPRRSHRHLGEGPGETAHEAPVTPSHLHTSKVPHESKAHSVDTLRSSVLSRSSRRSRSIEVIPDSEKGSQSTLGDDMDEQSVEALVQPLSEQTISISASTYGELPQLQYPEPSSPLTPASEAQHLPSGMDEITAGTSSWRSEPPIDDIPDVYMTDATPLRGGNIDDLLKLPEREASSSAPTASFYGKGKQKPEYVELDELDELDELESEPSPVGDGASTSKTLFATDEAGPITNEPAALPGTSQPIVFTLDSLGGKHPGLSKRLGEYLLLEAQDKLDRSKETLTTARYIKAEVPTQPNSCDCGVYLLHFARTFMNNPTQSIQIITDKKRTKENQLSRKTHWDEDSIREFRKEIRSRIESLSEMWKAERAVKEEEERNTKGPVEAEHNDTAGGAESAIPVSSDESDGEVEVVHIGGPSPPKPKPKPKPKKLATIPVSGKQYGTKSKQLATARANRIR